MKTQDSNQLPFQIVVNRNAFNVSVISLRLGKSVEPSQKKIVEAKRDSQVIIEKEHVVPIPFL